MFIIPEKENIGNLPKNIKICFYTSNLNTTIKVDTNYLMHFMVNWDPFTSSESQNFFDVCHFVFDVFRFRSIYELPLLYFAGV